MSTSDESLKETGRCAAAVLVEMVAALECDYDHLEELRDELKQADEDLANGCCALETSEMDAMRVELKELEEAAGECTSREDAETRIQEDALSVEVRSAWCLIGQALDMSASEFSILLSTGGPASRIRGELDGGEPSRAWLEVQDWGMPWAQYFDISQDTLLAYARCFYYGEGQI